MRRIIQALILVIVFGSVGSDGSAQAQSGPDRFVPFGQFVRGVLVAELRAYKARPGAQVEDSRAFEEMRRHILSLYQGVHARNSFVRDGQHFDCIPIREQPSFRLLGLKEIAAPPIPSSPAQLESDVTKPGPTIGRGSEAEREALDRFGNVARCEDGTIPMRRITLDELTRFKTLRQFFDKGPDGAGRPPGETPPAAAAAVHKYAYAERFVDNFGGNSWLNLWSPSVASGLGQIFSLAQQWYTGGSGTGLQTVEGGWQVYPAKYGTSNAVLFIYWTPDNYSSGCYNLDCPAFVQTNSNWYLGAGWSVYSTRGGTQYEFQMQWQLWQGNWWLFLQGAGSYEAVGYYPGSLYRGGQLTRNATRIIYGGETTSSTASFPPMGSGAFAQEGFSQAAYQRLIYYIDTAYTSQWAGLTPAEPSPACYTLSHTPASLGGSWGEYFFFGGPGGNSC